MNILIIIYLLIINIFGFSQMLYDKKQAKASQQRIPEKTLFLVAALGGALGTFIGMQVARHKTKHWSFLIAIPFLFVLNVVILYPMAIFGINNWITYVIHFLTK
ncbi:DUF1294 domain-containing protein [Shimazuella kribbensis]|uniref:DUF1294 domain-containing protein n=1 Tax=Shimazuella kribbensis TaxID=139808 RepID=UPI00056AAA73|nr:DUF1294 domain-containing protein [Shimazuella kribbensis]